MSDRILAEAARRRTFAIISHPDAGKTTLTEKLLLYAGAIEQAGAVKARRGGRDAVSDWMELERQRGISVSSTVLRFEHRGHVLNLLDTPGHADFSEDTYRVLTAVDAAVMVLDAAKGVEERTLRLFEVCRARGTPLITFVNKCDRPAPPPLGILDEQVFKVQANLDPRHRDRLAFVRVRSGRFERGMTVTLARTGRPFATSYAHRMFGRERETLDEAFPGDVVGLVNARELRLGDTLYEAEPVEFPPVPSFAPEHFSRARALDPARVKQFRRGLAQLEEEGVIQILRHPDLGDQAPVLAAVGPMQYDVARHRLEREFGVPVELTSLSYSLARRTDERGARILSGRRGAEVLYRSDGVPLALFESAFWLEQWRKEHPEAILEPLFSGKSDTLLVRRVDAEANPRSPSDLQQG